MVRIWTMAKLATVRLQTMILTCLMGGKVPGFVKTHRMQKAISKVPGYDKKAELLYPEAIERLYWKLQREGKIVD